MSGAETRRGILVSVGLASVLALGVAGCRDSKAPAANQGETTLTIGFGLTSGENAQAGIRQVIANIAEEGLVAFARDGRPQPWLAERWESSPDGLTWRISLKPGIRFHDGELLTAERVRQVLIERLPDQMGTAYEDVERIDVTTATELVLVLKRRSAFALEGLDVLIRKTGAGFSIGTGPFHAAERGSGQIEMFANEAYHEGPPAIDRLLISSYGSVRSAWADMLRGELDMLYEVGAEGLDSLEPSSHATVFEFPRRYASLVILNIRKSHLKASSVRRALNLAVDRSAIVEEGLNGQGRAAEGPVWPYHWAYDDTLPRFTYAPPAAVRDGAPKELTILYAEPSHERMLLLLQKQLSEVGTRVSFEFVPVDQAFQRLVRGDFEAFLVDASSGPTLLRSYLFWHSKAPRNWGGFDSARVDAALDAIRHAANDDEYQVGVGEFQRAIVDDPPAIFLAWGEGARAVSTRFEVPVEEGRDILSTLRLWRPVGPPQRAQRN